LRRGFFRKSAAGLRAPETKKPSVRGGLTVPLGCLSATSAFANHLARGAGWYGCQPNSECNATIALTWRAVNINGSKFGTSLLTSKPMNVRNHGRLE
jgi:hypothetical protein